MLRSLTYPPLGNPGNLNISGLSGQFKQLCVLDSNAEENTGNHHEQERILAIGSTRELIVRAPGKAYEQLQQLLDEARGWLFGYLSYDLKNESEKLSSENHDRLGLPLLHFFSPLVVMQISRKAITLSFDEEFISEAEAILIYKKATQQEQRAVIPPEAKVEAAISREQYLEAVIALKQHIRRGDIYEVNFCQEFFSKSRIDPADVYTKLNRISAAPFSAFGRFGSNYLLCASPERFLQKEGNTLLSQPIKGTARRSALPAEDECLRKELEQNEKERSENIMIVDLVRNDLSRIAERGTVRVDELCKAYSYKQVHQMISSVRCEVRPDISVTEILKSCFPMGSMTGAPKIRAMELIEQYESSKRGLYSGTVGYIDPEGNFDFNVVIRSILYNEEKELLSFMVGSAITDKAIPEQEYEECMLKAKAMFEVLENKVQS